MLVGVAGAASNLFADKNLKQQALFFERIELSTGTRYDFLGSEVEAEVGYLKERKFLVENFDYDEQVAKMRMLREIGASTKEEKVDLGELHEKLQKISNLADEKRTEVIIEIIRVRGLKKVSRRKKSAQIAALISKDYNSVLSHYAYIRTVLMRMVMETDAVCVDPFWKEAELNNIDRVAKQNDIYEIIVSNIPLPDQDVPWDDIFSFRSEASSQQQLRALRAWVSGIANGKLTYVEAVDKINFLKDEYRAHMKAAGIKAKSSIIRTAVVGAAEFIENSMKFKLKSLAESVFKISDVRADVLVEAERKAVGRELAYVVRAESMLQAR